MRENRHVSRSTEEEWRVIVNVLDKLTSLFCRPEI